MDKDKLWQAVLAQLQLTLSKSNYSLWFGKTFIKSLQQKAGKQIVEIAGQNILIRDKLEKIYQPEIREILDRLTHKKNELQFVIASQKTAGTSPASGPLFTYNPEKDHQVFYQKALVQTRLNPEFTFQNFAVATTNEMAYAAASNVAKNLGQSYNPLFIYGGVGVGKTHLMQAMGISVLQRNPEASILYCTGEEFTNEIIEAIRNKNTGIFKKKFRNVRLLLIDDIQFIAGRNTVQEEFFHTFNAIKQTGGQIVMTSDKPPEQIDSLENRLRSRFEGGLMIDIQEPNFELRTAILLIKAKQLGEEIPIEVAKIIAQEVESTRKLEGILARIISEKTITKKPIDTEMVKKVLIKIGSPAVMIKTRLSPDKIIQTVASYYQIKLSEIKGKRRLKPIVFPRQIAIYFLRLELKLPYQEIGRLFGGKDHTTIMYAEDKIKNWLQVESSAREELSQIRQQLVK